VSYRRARKPQAGRQRRYRPNATLFVPPAVSLGICPACGKRSYGSKQLAKQAARVLYPEARMRVYSCGRVWHMTSQDAETVAAQRARAAQRAIPPGGGEEEARSA
jgi:hypothetical protein